jgi:hypothetical protein
MKLDTITKPKFDPLVRVKEGKVLTVMFLPKDWEAIDRSMGRHMTSAEIHDLIMGIFSGKYSLVKHG